MSQSLAAIRGALNPIDPSSSQQEVDMAVETATRELRSVAAEVAGFANQLDDGVGFFDSSTTFGQQLAIGLDDVRRVSTVMGLLRGLDVTEMLRAAQLALLFVAASTGPDAAKRVLLSDDDRAALQNIGTAAADALLNAEMPNDPEND